MGQDSNEPSISVIVPTFRRFEPLIQTVCDLLKQEYPSFEVVVADQNPNWPEEFSESLERIKDNALVRWLSLESPGVVVARKRAVAASKGDLVVFVDDDVSIPNRSFLLT